MIRIFMMLIIFSIGTAQAESLCQGKFVNPLTDVCWSCLFPITLGSMNLVRGSLPDTNNPGNPVCICPGDPIPRIGLTIGFWEPIAMTDVTRSPFCMVNLGGLQLNIGNYPRGKAESASTSQNGSFYYVHWYKYPLIYWLNILTDALCVDKGDFDIAYLTELDPTWRNDELSFILNPEVALFANPVAQLACAADSAASLVGLPMDSLFWCAGSQGTMYPLNGNVQEHVGGVQSSTLLSERMAYRMSRLGLLWNSSSNNVCRQYPSAILPKSRYRYQMVNPIASTKNPDGCQPFGRSTARWGMWKEFPHKGEDFGYLIWRKRNCCAL